MKLMVEFPHGPLFVPADGLCHLIIDAGGTFDVAWRDTACGALHHVWLDQTSYHIVSFYCVKVDFRNAYAPVWLAD